jgi:hypothetical protein
VEIHRSARKHGVADEDIFHAVANQVGTFDLDPDADPPKILVIGPDRSANVLEVILLDFPDSPLLVIHAMRLTRKFYDLLPREGTTP